MRTIIARNIHQALAESCYQLDSFGVDQPDGGKILPIPTSTTILKPLERVPFYGVLDPFDMLLSSAYRLAYARFPNVVSGAANLKTDPSAMVTLYPANDSDTIASICVHVDADGSLQLMASGSSSDVIEAADLVYLSMVLEFMSSASRREVGAIWSISMAPRCTGADLGDLRVIASEAPQPPDTFHDPYSLDTAHATIPLVSIPSNRWMREASQFYGGAYDDVSYVDPFIQNVLAPAYRAYALYREGAPESQVQRAIGEIASQDWMIACLQYVSQKATA